MAGKTDGPIVTSASDNGPGSLRQAVAHVKSGQSITFRLGKRKKLIRLTSGTIALKSKIRIIGPGAKFLTISALDKSQVFSVESRAVVTISGLTLSHGRAARGGGIYNAGKLTLSGDSFTLNFASVSGTADLRPSVAVQAFDPRVRGRQRRARRHPHAPSIGLPSAIAVGSGAAIYNAPHATLNISDVTFKDNAAPLGGAIDNEGTADVTASTFIGNSGLQPSGSPETGAYGYGGAIYNSGKLTVLTSSFSDNVVGGKSIASYGAGGAIAQTAGSAKISGTTFSSNSAGGGTGGSWGIGGAVYVSSGTLTLASDTFASNAAGGDSFGYGGAVYDDLRFAGTHNTFARNAAIGSGKGGTAAGGAIYAGGGLTLSGSALTANAAMASSSNQGGYASGGAIDAESSSTLTSLKVTSNTASGGAGGEAQGGGIYLGGGSSSAWTGVAFAANSAVGLGAGSYSSGGAACVFGALTVQGSVISSNRASAASSGSTGAQGGGIAVEVGPFAFTGTVSANSATTEGGGLWLDDVATVTNSYIFGNTVTSVQNADDGGGGIYVGTNGDFSLSGSTLARNSSQGAVLKTGGGGLFNAGSAALVNSTISQNSSSMDGGGLENIATSNVTLTNVTIYQNTATGEGGSIKNLYSDAALTVTNSIVADGTSAGALGDVSNDGRISSGDYNIITSWSGNAMVGSTTNNIQSDPALLALANNGGPTPTNADTAASPGTALIPFDNCLAVSVIVDQRGLARGITHAGQCDVGAYENQTS